MWETLLKKLEKCVEINGKIRVGNWFLEYSNWLLLIDNEEEYFNALGKYHDYFQAFLVR